jgi:GTP-binding protein LepA
MCYHILPVTTVISLLLFRVNDLVKLEIKINNELADPLSIICHRDSSYRTGKALCSKLKELIPRQMFRVPIQVRLQLHLDVRV